MQKRLPHGIQNFDKLIRKNYLYIDKTKEIYKLIEPPSGSYFLSRPRRFGKSLLVSTLAAIFSNKKELFSELWLYNSSYTWEQYPIIQLDMSSVSSSNVPDLIESIKDQLAQIASKYNVTLDTSKNTQVCLNNLILNLSKLHNQEEIVVLIDEYDHPLISKISDLKLAEQIRSFLNEFYGVFKSKDANIRFMFLTGVSKFSRASIFSGINHLTDISTSDNFASLLGYTQEEIEKNFSSYISKLAENQKTNQKETLQKIKKWYNGYRFSEAQTLVYNPHSTIELFSNQKFKNYWFTTGTPSFLIDLIQKQGISPIDLEQLHTIDAAFECFEIDNLQTIPLLVQTGYLTIKDYSPENNLFKLGYPNNEVFISFTYSLLTKFSHLKDKTLVENKINTIIQSLHSDDIESFLRTLKIFFASIPYSIQINNEKYYQSIFFMLLHLINQNIKVEQYTNIGRIDAVIETKSTIYVIEFKLNGNTEDAIKQILEKKYYESYLNKGKNILALGVEFKNRNIGEYIIKEIQS